MNIKHFILLLLTTLSFLKLNAQSTGYAITNCNKKIILNRNILNLESVKIYTVNATDFLSAATSEKTTLEIQTPKQKGTFTVPMKPIKVSDITSSVFFSTSTSDSYWDTFVQAWDMFMKKDEPKNVYADRMKEYGGMKIGTKGKQGEHTGKEAADDAVDADDKKYLAHINDSLQQSGVTDSVIYYLNDGFFLERKKYIPEAKMRYDNALRYATKTNKDTTLIKTFLEEFTYRTSAQRKNEADDFFK